MSSLGWANWCWFMLFFFFFKGWREHAWICFSKRMIRLSSKVLQVLLGVFCITLLVIDSQQPQVFNSSIPKTNKTDLDAFVWFFFPSTFGALREARHKKHFKFGCLVCSIALYGLRHCQRQKFNATGFSGTLLGINWQTSTDQVDKGAEFLMEMFLHEFKDVMLYGT